VTTPSPSEPKVLWYETFDNGNKLGKIWQFYDHTLFENIWLARRIKMSYYVTLSNGESNVLFQSALYTLVSSANKPLGVLAYDPRTYLLSHTTVTDETGANIKSFIYEPANGSLKSQRRNETELSQSVTTTAQSTTSTSLIGLIVTLATSICWFVARRTTAHADKEL